MLDLSRLTFMDSSGVHGVVELASRAARLNIDLVVIPDTRAVRRLVELCHFRSPSRLQTPHELKRKSRETPQRPTPARRDLAAPLSPPDTRLAAGSAPSGGQAPHLPAHLIAASCYFSRRQA